MARCVCRGGRPDCVGGWGGGEGGGRRRGDDPQTWIIPEYLARPGGMPAMAAAAGTALPTT